MHIRNQISIKDFECGSKENEEGILPKLHRLRLFKNDIYRWMWFQRRKIKEVEGNDQMKKITEYHLLSQNERWMYGEGFVKCKNKFKIFQ